MVVPIRFPKIPAASLANYNWIDAAEGTGIVVYYGFSTEDNGTTTYGMTTDTPHSNTVLTFGETTGAAAEKVLDLDFDLEYNLPKTIKGKFYASVPFVQGNTDLNYHADSWIVVKVRKWDGASETEIASNTKSTVKSTASAEVRSFIVFIEIDIATATTFAVGDSLRVTVELWLERLAANNGRGALFHDPADRTHDSAQDNGYSAGVDSALDEDAGVTQLKFYVPYKLDL